MAPNLLPGVDDPVGAVALRKGGGFFGRRRCLLSPQVFGRGRKEKWSESKGGLAGKLDGPRSFLFSWGVHETVALPSRQVVQSETGAHWGGPKSTMQVRRQTTREGEGWQRLPVEVLVSGAVALAGSFGASVEI
uniref:Uncharacterized protein n=1 Tax=Chromera velia CCMP2878 TaxID=1169474 RepID=A0A0G4G400_9ALVE|eukprot:Cvel_20007.t1-p1 / transcript=Cvel_20007.t1 / gene=Cvel_20007 / organism=Chromera_velia_CCMP2878 / gene_product=hypothetical protein / transcript_product=hypothetical protein / location=Cvel_scaffold1764:20496-20894(+) / protein_length=133 / sequence_SO=supercontig / SO=protein_coding / is_pseudo=false